MGDTFNECQRAVESLRRNFIRLGFKIQPEKGVFMPTREITFLGYVLNSVTMKVYPTGEKIQKGLEMLREIRAKKKIKIRTLAALIGTLNDLTKGCEYGMGHYRFLERDKTRGLALYRGDFEADLNLSDRAKEDLGWWILNLNRAERRIWLTCHKSSSLLTLVTMDGGQFFGTLIQENNPLMGLGASLSSSGILTQRRLLQWDWVYVPLQGN